MRRAISAPNRRHQWIVKLILSGLLFTLLLVGTLQVVQPYQISGTSMFPTIHEGQYLIINRLAYVWSEPRRSDTIIFEPANVPASRFVKRVIAVAGDEVVIENGHVSVNGIVLTEPYLTPDTHTTCLIGMTCRMTVPVGTVFVLGDNRDASVDSRMLGPVSIDSIVGEVLRIT